MHQILVLCKEKNSKVEMYFNVSLELGKRSARKWSFIIRLLGQTNKEKDVSKFERKYIGSRF